ncbi:gliding motility-associated C-terminal domain-containing protein [Lutimonas vermicola]|uniref:Gliding motility-associated C-terminal domain-containing protein n=1 Tax=Lutimonas vermicola TaxID=414288 RepID=A0ABU9L2D7_9FLAO
MKRDYFTFNFSNSKSISIKRLFLGLVMMLSVSFVYAQSTLTVQTVSSSNPWRITAATPGAPLTWEATGAVTQTRIGSNVNFDFSSNGANGVITITTTAPNFNGVTALVANYTIDLGGGLSQGQQIFSIDLSDLTNLQVLNLDNNSLININVTDNSNLTDLSLNGNGSITALDISSNPLLKVLNMQNTSLSSVQIDNILNQLDLNGLSNGTINFSGISTGSITANGIQAYTNLVNKGWFIEPPQGFDRGDAPDTYMTSLANNGPLHFSDVLNDALRIGVFKDNDLNRPFGPTPDADGDDLDDGLGAGDDEDGVDLSQFDNYYHTDTNFALEVELTNLLGANSYLHAWIDFDLNGTFDADEYASIIVPANTGIGDIQTLNWDVTVSGADVNFGKSFVRIRYTSDNDLNATSVGGVANGGEVEDYTFIMLDGTDTDNDGVPDITDVDDDNDGILDVTEDNGVTDRDTDGDGFPDRIDLDADGDGCNDVTEAGFDDGGDDDELGLAPLVVDLVTELGKVIADANGPINDPTDAYGPPADADGNGTPDFQEVGLAATITTEPVDQDLIIGVSTFSIVADANTYQWQEDKQDGNGFVDIVDGGDYAGTLTADLLVTNSDVSKLLYRYQVIISNSFYACDATTTSIDVGYITPDDFDLDGVFDIVDEDDDNDGILDTIEDNGVVDRDTDADGFPDRIDLDSDDDTCFDVTEAGFTDVNGDGMLGDVPVVVDPLTGLVTSGTDGYTPPVNNNGSADPDFQVFGVAATITTEPVDQDLIIGVSTFSIVAEANTYQWQEDKQDGNGFVDIVDGGDYAGALTADLLVTNSDVSKLLYRYQVIISNSFYACDATTTSIDVGYITPDDFDLDGVFDIVDEDDDNDGILDTIEDNGVVDRDTDADGFPDRIDLDSDDDTCFDVTEAGFTDVNGDGMLGDVPVVVDPLTGLVTSGTDGYTPPVNNNGSADPDFQVFGVAATITTEPTNQDLSLINPTVFSVVGVGDTFQWQEDKQDGNGFVDIVDGGDYAGAQTADLTITNSDFIKVRYEYQVIISNSVFACDPTITSVAVTFINPDDFDKDGVFDLVDEDDDNDGILDTVEDNGVVDRDTDADGFPDRIDLDADDDGCFDVDENLYDNNGINEVGNQNPPVVDAVTGIVTSLGTNGGYGVPEDQDGNGTPDFQEAGAAATITTQPVDQNLIIGVTTFNVLATADTYQWQESTDGGATWAPLVDGGDYAGTLTSDLQVTNLDVSKLTFRYRVLVNNIAYACDPVTVSAEARYIAPDDFDNDGVFDIVDVDDDNDGILDTDEPGNTDPGTNEDRINLDADNDGCFDVTEAGFTDNGMGMLGTANPPVVDASGLVTSATDGYTPPNDLDNNGTPDFQEAGAAAAITTQPADQNFIPGGTVTFDVIASADTYQWEESTDGTTWTALVDGGNYTGATTASLTVSNVDISMLGYAYRVRVNNIAYACDPVTTSDIAALVSLPDNDNDGVPDIVDVDDDNDGIFDTDEQDVSGADIDSNNNGTPDRFELDSDSDGCDDVVEAGFTDGDGDGLLGNSPVTVNPATGQVTSGSDGYTTPNDLDNNGTYDFQEAGTAANITGDPIDQDFVLGGSAIYTATSDGDTYQWEISTDGVSFTPLSDDAKYSGTATASLTVSDLVIPDYFNEYRVVASNVAFVCDPGDASASASYNILLDTDNDGVFDIVDVDDDNDGISDTVEGEVTDTNLDGRPDRISLDADGDGCADAIEAGFEDPDGDGILGTSPVTVDANGQVTGQGGYTTPNDLDNNGGFDFQEAGEPSAIENQPEEVEIALGDDAIFEVSATATFYQWQQSVDGGTTWTDLVNDAKFSGVTTDRLLISDARGRLEGSWYRVVLTSPDFACDPVMELISDGVRLVFNTELIPSGFSPNGDGENDLFSIPGLIETPDFTMEVFDRWGNSVYQYMNNGSLNPEWWDGRSTGNMTLSKGQLVPAGTYFYLIKYNDGNKSPDKGWVYVNY